MHMDDAELIRGGVSPRPSGNQLSRRAAGGRAVRAPAPMGREVHPHGGRPTGRPLRPGSMQPRAERVGSHARGHAMKKGVEHDPREAMGCFAMLILVAIMAMGGMLVVVPKGIMILLGGDSTGWWRSFLAWLVAPAAGIALSAWITYGFRALRGTEGTRMNRHAGRRNGSGALQPQRLGAPAGGRLLPPPEIGRDACRRLRSANPGGAFGSRPRRSGSTRATRAGRSS